MIAIARDRLRPFSSTAPRCMLPFALAMESSAPFIRIRTSVYGSADVTRVLAPTWAYSRAALLLGLMRSSSGAGGVEGGQQRELLREELAGRGQLGNELVERRELIAQAVFVRLEMCI